MPVGFGSGCGQRDTNSTSCTLAISERCDGASNAGMAQMSNSLAQESKQFLGKSKDLHRQARLLGLAASRLSAQAMQ